MSGICGRPGTLFIYICWQVCHSVLITDIIYILIASFKDKDVELILLMLRSKSLLTLTHVSTLGGKLNPVSNNCYLL